MQTNNPNSAYRPARRLMRTVSCLLPAAAILAAGYLSGCGDADVSDDVPQTTASSDAPTTSQVAEPASQSLPAGQDGASNAAPASRHLLTPKEMLDDVPEATPTGWKEFDTYYNELESIYLLVTDRKPISGEIDQFRTDVQKLAGYKDDAHMLDSRTRQMLAKEIDRYIADLPKMSAEDRVARIHPIFSISLELARDQQPHPFEGQVLRIETMMHGLDVAGGPPTDHGEQGHIVVPPGAAPGVLTGP